MNKTTLLYETNGHTTINFTQSRKTQVLSCLAVVAASLTATTAMAMTGSRLKPVLADITLLEAVGAEVIATHQETGVGYAQITPAIEAKLSRVAHDAGKCGGFEALPEQMPLSESGRQNVFGAFNERRLKDQMFENSPRFLSAVRFNPAIAAAISEVSEQSILDTVQFLSNYQTRFHKATTANDHVVAFKARIESMLASSAVAYQVDLITHSSTRQKSIRVRIPGTVRPSEIVVMGGHLDSINQEWYGPKNAPGADDNASGSADILEALRVLASKGQPARTLDFFWYAGEEGGLLGSAEIAQAYKAANADVVAVLQLDMTLYPGSGEFTLGSMNDFTSSWLRNYLVDLNANYIKARIVDDKCGYGCSDHASWHRQGYPAIMPFEATFNGMNHALHTAKDVISTSSNFRHAAMFAKIAVAIGMDLGNSAARENAP